MADVTKPEETIKPEEEVVQTAVALEPDVAPQEGQIDHKFFKRIQWGLTAATVFCGAAGFTAAHYEDKERAAASAPAVAPASTAKPITPLVHAPS